MTYDFDEKRIEGEKYEEQQDAHWCQWFKIEETDLATNKTGIDRIFWSLLIPMWRFTVEYKGDDKASDYGNLFIELESIQGFKLGWGLECAAQMLSVFVPREGVFYWLSVPFLHVVVRAWITQYELKRVQNNGYVTTGIAVPRNIVSQSPGCLGVFEVRQDP